MRESECASVYVQEREIVCVLVCECVCSLVRMREGEGESKRCVRKNVMDKPHHLVDVFCI